MILWVTFVYCPLAHMVWAYDWFAPIPASEIKGSGGSPIGLLGKLGGARFRWRHRGPHCRRHGRPVLCTRAPSANGHPGHTIQPNSMVLTLLGAGLLWFGWFGFNGGSSLNSTALGASAFAATQAAAAAAGLSWIFVEWLLKGKPTALGLASGIVAGLVAVTPASGFVADLGRRGHGHVGRDHLLLRRHAQAPFAAMTRSTPSAFTRSAVFSAPCSRAFSVTRR